MSREKQTRCMHNTHSLYIPYTEDNIRNCDSYRWLGKETAYSETSRFVGYSLKKPISMAKSRRERSDTIRNGVEEL
jgi:hypothetical protein